MITESSTRIIPISTIHIHKLSVVTASKKQIELYRTISSQSPKSLPSIKVARIENKLYVFSGMDIYHGVKLSKLNDIQCEIIDFKNDVDFVIEHVKQHKNPSGFNQFSLFKIVDFLDSNNISKEKAYGLLQIYQTTNSKLLDLKLHSDTVKQLSSLYDFLSEKLTSFSIPFYIPQYLSNFELQIQSEKTNELVNLIKTYNISDNKFSWPSPESVTTLLGRPEENKSVIINTVKPTPKEKKITESVLINSKNIIGIPGNDDTPSFVINKKTGAVSEIKDQATITKLQSAKTQDIFIFPPKIVKFLNLTESYDSVKSKKFSNSESLISYLRKNPDLKGVVFFNES